MNAPTYILLARNATAEGVKAIGPFFYQKDAEVFADGQGGDWHVIEVTPPGE